MTVNTEAPNRPPSASARSVLYILYDGLTDPLGRSQVLPYLTGLAALGHRITILSCEKADRYARDGERLQEICALAGLNWVALRYHKRPPVLSSLYDAAALRRTAVRLHRRAPFDIVHCRSYIPSLAGLHLRRRHGVRFLFDMRGFWPDEKVEGGAWRLANPVFRAVYTYFKSCEERFLKGADHVVSLTHAGKRVLLARSQTTLRDEDVTVIPCCVDFEHFPLVAPKAQVAARAALGIEPDRKVVAYLGSLGTWYMLDEMLDFFTAYLEREPDALFLLITYDDAGPIRAAATRRGLNDTQLIVRPAAREEVPGLMGAAEFGLFFIRPVPSKVASSPTKMGEMLALGLPIVTNAGVGDVAEIMAAIGCGAVVERFEPEAYHRAISEMECLQLSSEAIRRCALPLFDANLGVARYAVIYEALGAKRIGLRRRAPG